MNGTCATPTGGRRTIHFDALSPGQDDVAVDRFPLPAGASRCYRVVVHDGTYPTLDAGFVASLTYQGV